MTTPIRGQLRAILTPNIPDGEAEPFWRDTMQHNYRRMVVVAIALLLIETLLVVLFPGQMLGSETSMWAFILLSIVQIPGLIFLRSRADRAPIWLLEAVQYLYVLTVLGFGIGITLASQETTDLMHVYMLCIFGAMYVVFHRPVWGGLSLTVSQLVFFLLIPRFQPDPELILITRINSVIACVIGVIFARMNLTMRLNQFLTNRKLEQQNIILADQSRRDSMTLLLNHESVFEHLSDEIDLADKDGSALSVILADIDDFKQVNDRFGHPTGDRIIREVADILRNTARESDIIGRYGGEEFIVILPGAPEKAARRLAERIRKALSEKYYGDAVRITLSGGISQYAGESMEELIRRTDAKLYQAKRAGKNRFEAELI